MKVLAFYAAGLLMLCVMVFGGIEGFSFELRIETSDYILKPAESNTFQKMLLKRAKDFPENSTSRAKYRSNR